MDEWRQYPCKIWKGSKSKKGYGLITISGKRYRLHRLAWEKVHGPIPRSVLVLHRCDTPACYEEKHLFIGTIGDNNRDMVAKGRHWSQQKTHCPSGHPYTPENTIKKGTTRVCRICYLAQLKRTKAKKKEAKR